MSGMNNPYQTPNASAQAMKPSRDFPGALKVMAILFIVFGSIGILGGLCGGPFLFLQAAANSTGATRDEAEDLTPEQLANVIQTELQPPIGLSVGLLVISGVVSIIMLVGGIMALKGAAASKSALIAGCLGGMVCQLGGIANGLFQIMHLLSLGTDLKDRGMDAEVEGMFSMIQWISIGSGAFGMVVGVVLIGLYLSGMVYLIRSTRVRAFLSPA
jgi:hypothetical protein